jgi:hypothetical protein
MVKRGSALDENRPEDFLVIEILSRFKRDTTAQHVD